MEGGSLIMEINKEATVDAQTYSKSSAKKTKTKTKSGGNMPIQLFIKIIPQISVLVLFIGGWEGLVRVVGTPAYILPKPSDIIMASAENWSNLVSAVTTSMTSAVIGFLVSVVLGIGIAILLSLSKLVEKSVYPYVIILQTIPIVAVAPIIVIWFGAGLNAIIIISFLISFFPILSNTLIGLNSTDQNSKDLFYLYNASKWQTIWKLRLPAALPYIMAGLKISCTMAVIGAIVGEYIAGIGGGDGGLGYSITVAASRLQTPYLFACGLAAAVLGIVFFLLINALSKATLGSWHDSEIKH